MQVYTLTCSVKINNSLIRFFFIPETEGAIHRTEKRWRLYILPQYLANLSEPLAHTDSHILAKFIPVLTKLFVQGLKFSDLFCAFYERFWILMR